MTGGKFMDWCWCSTATEISNSQFAICLPGYCSSVVSCSRVHVNTKWQLFHWNRISESCVCACLYVAMLISIRANIVANQKPIYKWKWLNSGFTPRKKNPKWCDCNQIDLIMFYRMRFCMFFGAHVIIIIVGIWYSRATKSCCGSKILSIRLWKQQTKTRLIRSA